MDHRLFAVLAIVCFALEGAGCASESERARREQVLMPLQTGSGIQRKVMIDTGGVSKKSKEKKEKKETKEPKPTSPKPTPAATPTPTPEPSPQAEPESTPDRFR
jgi:outer membrane biosynthesis protein TonB